MNPIHEAAILDPNSVSPGLLGFIIVVIIGIATWFLARSMAKHLRKLDADQPEQPDAEPQDHGVGNGKGPEPNGAH